MSTVAPQPPAPPPAPPPRRTPEHRQFIDDQVERTRRALQWTDFAVGAIGWASAMLAFLLAAAVLDHWVFRGGLSTWMRIGLFGLLLAGFAWHGWRTLAPLVRPINPAFAAQTIERHSPTLKNSLLNLLLFRSGRQQLSTKVYDAIEQQTAERLALSDVDDAVDKSAALRRGYGLVAVAAICALYAVLSPKDVVTSASRVLLPWADISAPSRVQISDVTPGDGAAARGEVATIAATIAGAKPEEAATLRFRPIGVAADEPLPNSEAAEQTLSMRPVGETTADGAQRVECQVPAPGGRGATLGLQQPLEYWIEAGDARTRLFRLSLFSRPTIVVQRIQYAPPAYTGLPSSETLNTGDVEGLEGTRVTISAQANRPIATAFIDFNADGRRDVKMQVDGDRAIGTFTLALGPDGRGARWDNYVLKFTDDEGRTNDDPAKYRIAVTADYPPEVRMTQPQGPETTVAVNDAVKIGVDARDPDFALTGVRVEGDVDGRRITMGRLLQERREGRFQGALRFVPAEARLQPGQVIEIWAVAEDNRRPQANVSTSERQRLRIAGPSQGGGAGDQGAKQPGGAGEAGGQGEQGDNPAGESGNASQDQEDGAQRGESDPNAAGESGESGEGESGGESSAGDQGEKQSGQGKQQEGEQGESGSSESGPGIQGPGGQSGEQAEHDQGAESGGSGQSGGEQNDEQNANESSGSGQAGGDNSANSTNNASADGAGGEPNGDGRDQSQPGNASQGNHQPATGEPNGGQSAEEPVSTNGDDDATAFERLAEHFGAGESDSKQANNSQSQPGANQSEKSGQAGDQSKASPANQSGDSDEQTSANGSEQAGGQQDAQAAGEDSQEGTLHERDSSQPGAGAGDHSAEQNPQESASDGGAEEGEQEQRDPEGVTNPNQGGGGSGQEDQEQASPDAGQSPQGREKTDRDPQGAQPQSDEAPSGGQSKKESDSTGGQSGDQSGGGSTGAGQRANSEGQGAPGENTAADEGAGAAQEQGPGETGAQGGEEQLAPDQTGQSSGDQPGAGSQQGETGRQPGEQAESSPQASSEGEQADARDAGSQSSGNQSADQQSNSADASHNQGEQPANGGTPSPPSGSSAGGANLSPPSAEAEVADEANLDFARQQTDLILEQLDEQLAKQQVDSSLLKKLGWSEADLRRFVDRWKNLRDRAASDGANGEDAQAELDDALRSLGPRFTGPQKFQARAAQDQLRAADAYRERAPRSYQDRVRAYVRGAAVGEERRESTN